MAGVSVEIKSRSILVVEAKCLDESGSWSFDDKEDAEWFREIVQEYWNARCPKCGVKNILGLDVHGDQPSGWEVLVSCGYHTCSFAKRIVSWDDPDTE